MLALAQCACRRLPVRPSCSCIGRAQVKSLEELFADYAPPNADDYLPGALVSKKLWPRITPGWCIAYNSELVKNPPKTWMDLTRGDLYKPGTIAQVIAPSGGTTWTRVMFERQVLGDFALPVGQQPQRQWRHEGNRGRGTGKGTGKGCRGKGRPDEDEPCV